MKRTPLTAAIAVLAMTALIALRLDLADLFRRRGDMQLQAGNIPAARTSYRYASAFGHDRAPLDYNLGVTLYRAGSYRQAQQQFSSVSDANAHAQLHAAAAFNRGNSYFRLAEQSLQQDRKVVGRPFQQAVTAYRQALTYDPGAADVRANLELARARLQLLTNGAQGDTVKVQRNQRNKSDTENSKPGKVRDSKAGQPTSTPKTVDKIMGGNSSGKSYDSTPKKLEMTPSEAERLLSEARGRERLSGLTRPAQNLSQAPGPDKDW